jgi:hypothetical protein
MLEGSVSHRGIGSVQWNGEPVNVDFHPNRVWDWSDPQFLRGLHKATSSSSLK